MRQFKIVGGGHSERGKFYETGQVVETELDLVGMFGKKFQEIVLGEPETKKKKKKGKAKGTRPFDKVEKPKAKKIRKRAKDARGIDETKNFPIAVEHSFEIFRKGSWYHVFEKGNKDPVFDKGLKKADVNSKLEKYLEA